MLEGMLDLLPLLVAAVTVIAWLARLESRVSRAAEETARLERQMADDRAASRDSRKELLDVVREVQRDIKRLLEKTGTPPLS